MGIFSETLSSRSMSRSIILNAGIPRDAVTATLSSSDDPSQKSMKDTSNLIRVPAADLEQIYISDPIAFNSVNKAVQAIMGASYELDEEGKDYYKKFFANIGNIGEDLTTNEIFNTNFQYGLIYGKCFTELVYNKNDTKIVDLSLMDPKRTDYARNAEHKIVRDKFGKPVGYTQKVPAGYDTRGKSDEVPAEYKGMISLESNQIFLLPKRVFHFKLYTIGDRDEPIGILEPAYKSIVRKQNIEEAQANSIYSRGTYPVIAYVGDAEHESTPQDIEATLDNLIKLKHDRYLAFQHWIKVEPLEVKQSDIVDTTIKSLITNQVSASGIPMSFATSEGGAANKHTLANQQQFFEYTLKDIVERFIASFTKYVLKRINETNKVGYIPTIKWGDIKAEDITDKVKRIIECVKASIYRPDEVHDFIKNLEGI